MLWIAWSTKTLEFTLTIIPNIALALSDHSSSRSGRPCWLGWTELKSGRRNQVSCQLNILNASIRRIGRARHRFEISNQMQFLFRRPWAWWHTNFNTCWRNYEQVLIVFQYGFIAKALFCIFAMPLPSLTRAVTGVHYIGCGGARLMVFLEQVISFNWQPLNAICSPRQQKTHSKMTYFSPLIEYFTSQWKKLCNKIVRNKKGLEQEPCGPRWAT